MLPITITQMFKNGYVKNQIETYMAQYFLSDMAMLYIYTRSAVFLFYTTPTKIFSNKRLNTKIKIQSYNCFEQLEQTKTVKRTSQNAMYLETACATRDETCDLF